MPIRVLVADDHSMVRQGLQMFFDGDPEVTIVGEARNGEEAVTKAQDLRADVVLMDLLMPGIDGVAATRALRQASPHAHVVAMTSVVEESGVHRAIEAGAIGYVLKDTRPDELREADPGSGTRTRALCTGQRRAADARCADARPGCEEA